MTTSHTGNACDLVEDDKRSETLPRAVRSVDACSKIPGNADRNCHPAPREATAIAGVFNAPARLRPLALQAP